MSTLPHSYVLGNGSWVPPPGSLATGVDETDHRQNVWLFNITGDPNETQDLSKQYPTVVKKLLDRLAFYNSTSVPVRYPAPDPRSNPKLHDEAWGPWE